MTTAIDINTGRHIFVKLVAIHERGRSDILRIADAITGKGVWLESGQWCADAITGKGAWMKSGYQWCIDMEDNDFDYVAERVECVYCTDEKEWEASANVKLAEYGLKLGKFDEEAGDRWELVDGD